MYHKVWTVFLLLMHPASALNLRTIQNHIDTIYQRPNEILKFVLEDAQSADLGRIETLLAGIEDMTALISYWNQHMVTNMRFRVRICPMSAVPP
jgi:hypothetical protein